MTEDNHDDLIPPARALASAPTCKPRRKQPPPQHRRPKQAEAMRRRWTDPSYRAKQEKHFAARRADPTKAWSRKGIGDGYTRETAAEAWQAADERAQVAMAALKRAGLV